MKKNSSWFLWIILFVALSMIQLPAQKKVKPIVKEIPPISLLPCPDIEVALFQAKLESTQVGDTSIDFPHDTVRLLLELKNAGSIAVPPGTVLHIVFKKNDQVIRSVDPRDALSDKGSRFAMGVSDSFPHDLKTTYSVEVTAPIRECTVRNNQASLAIDEAQLHPGGAPDFICSMFTVEKRWTNEGDTMKGTCFFAADVTNIGAGYCRDDAKPVDLQFYSTKNKSQILAFVRIPKNAMPGPKAKKRFSTEVPDSSLYPGKIDVCAFIPPTFDEAKIPNNWSTNSVVLDNSAMPTNGSMARVSFKPWGMTGRILNIRIKIQNLQYQTLKNLRLILLKNNAVIKEWKSIELGPGATIQKNATDDRPEVERGASSEQFKAILTTNQSAPTPPANAILDARTRPLYYLDFAQGLLQALFRDETDGLGAQIERQHSDITIHDNETLAQIYNQLLYIQLKGNKRLKGGAKVGFRASIYLKLDARNGNLVAEITKTDVEVGSKLSEAFLTILLPGIYQGIKHGIEKSAKKALGSMDIGNIGGFSLCGIVLGTGYMYLYSPYSI